MPGLPSLPSGRASDLLNLQRILDVLRNPQAHPREAVLIVSMIVVIVLILVVFLLLLVLRPAPKKPAERKPRKIRPPHVRALVLMIGLSVMSILFVGSLSVAVTQPPVCNLCHQMKQPYNSWHASSHARTDCSVCHRKPGLSGFTAYTLDRLGDVPAYARQTLLKTEKPSEPLKSDVASDSCLLCHSERVSKTFTAHTIRVRHKDFLEIGQRCTLCHNTPGHGNSVTNPKYPSMSLCTQCHNGKKESADCKLCHSQDIGSVARRESVPLPKVTIGPPTTCRGCHPVDTCNQCHRLELPHPADWTDNVVKHAAPAAFEKQAVCLKCHPIEHCNRCHQFPGHGDPAVWKLQHGPNALANRNCESCHKALVGVKDFCSLCH